jgi:hypothetical protein
MDIDLEPSEYRSEREKPKEPFFGPGLPQFIVLVILIFVVAYVREYTR